MAKSPWKYVTEMGIELGTACMPRGHASDRPTVPGLRKNSKLTGHVCFVNQALFFFDGIGENQSAEHHESNSSVSLERMRCPTVTDAYSNCIQSKNPFYPIHKWKMCGVCKESGTFRPQTISPTSCFAPKTFPPLVVSPLVVLPPSRFAPITCMEEGSGEFAINQ